MKNITEASTLSGLGIPDNIVKRIHTEFSPTLKHDHEFEELKTKGQMQTKLKRGKLIIGFSPKGDIASMREGGKRHTRYYGTIGSEEVDSSASMKDMLTNFSGRGWKWFATVDGWRDKPYHEFRRQETPNYEIHDAFKDKLEKVHGPKLRKEAAQYAEDIKEFLVTFATGDEVKVDKHRWRGDADPNDLYMGKLRRAMHNLRKVASSDTPHHEFSPKGIADLIDQNVGEPKVDYDFQKVDDKSGKYMRNAKLGTAKVAQLVLRKLRAYRDDVIDAAKKDRASQTKKRSLGKVKKAWESYKDSGKVNVLSEDEFDQYAAEVDPYTSGYKAGLKQEEASRFDAVRDASAFQAYKAWIIEVGQSSASVKNAEEFVRGWNDGEAISGVGI